MPRSLDTPNPNFAPARTSVHGGYTSPVLDLLGCIGASVTIVGAGTTQAGTWQLWESNFAAPTTANSVAVTGVSATTSGTPGNVQLDFAINGRYCFLVFTDTGSTSDATVAIATRTVAAGTV